MPHDAEPDPFRRFSIEQSARRSGFNDSVPGCLAAAARGAGSADLRGRVSVQHARIHSESVESENRQRKQ